ncbi:2-octaprenyl-6-methoxyphenyl hydroxylase [Lacimicrobium sp. SS2-24]|uniref:2-octaprenyl-6-methoxyphenyl hydroxylase n=1 Tax=Lacimicrobium sp. SS2-24 TaxID=2005569 RepID=UPI000B4A74B7|nr:2-octaprenyl-6-methoxyphenyl hydroxylase [Lacimicrobium sp. SS2-24]
MAKYDVMIAGGGAVGCLLALALSGNGMKVAVVEAKAYDQQASGLRHPGFDARSIALSHQSAAYLQQLGLTEPLLQHSTAIKRIKVTDQGHIGQCLLDHHQQRVDALGYVISQQELGAMLYQAVAGKVDWFCPDSISAVKTRQDGMTLALDSGSELNGSLLVVAEGGKSATAALLGLHARVEDYAQSAVVANVKVDRPHQNVAYERFTRQGPLALLPNQEKGFGLVWSVTTSRTQILMDCSKQHFLAQLQQHFGYSAGRFCELSRRSSYPLELCTLNNAIRHRTVVIGNAAHTLHPIAGQGFNLGLRDAECLSGLLLAQWRARGDVGDIKVLQHYQKWRRQDQHRVIHSTDALVRLFSNDYWPLVGGRNLGLGLLEAFSPLRQRFANAAMGYGGQDAAC